MNESKLVKSIVAGAIVGAIVSMFDRKTREHTIEATKKAKDQVVYYAKNREELQQMIEQKVEAAQKIYVNTSENINAIASKLEETKKFPERVPNSYKESKSEIILPENLN
ncbi:YtxH domain-containing protein [Ureibacillus aquaedulcis]|uniref:YtxH domain-containing protein n=1 Tax=Ureibacillus aquaedulcis TaxID=3058421 RepID=A0ABT8GUE5_9BACL|nr:YtxH domain-containing protein [Ureibacillus sp. BA0131]MDN4495042.1 YtxH domain-containing protein [Ureibacillus sp. BA0131]